MTRFFGIREFLLSALALAATAFCTPAWATLAYIAGDNQRALPGAQLPAPMQARNDAGGTRFIRFRIIADGTGGALFPNGQQASVFSLGNGVTGSQQLTLGTGLGVVQVDACLGLFTGPGSSFECGSGENTLVFTHRAQRFELLQILPTADPATGSAGANVTLQARLLYNGGVAAPGSFDGVKWSLASDTTGGARLNGGTAVVTVVPDGSGFASVTLTLGPTPARSVTIDARVDPPIGPGLKAQSGDLPIVETFVVNTATQPPAITLLAPSAVTGTSATLNATVDPRGSPTVFRFDHRVQGNPTFQSTADQNVGNGSGPVSTAANIATSCGTVHEYRGRATANATDTTTAWQTFATGACPIGAPTLSVPRALAIGRTSARLEADVGTGGGPTQVQFEIRASTASSFQPAGTVALAATPATQTPFVDVTTLVCGTSYTVRATATNATSSAGPTSASFQTSVCEAPVVVLTTTTPTMQREAGAVIALRVDAASQVGGLAYDWDVDGDGRIDRRSTQPTLDVTYPVAFDGFVRAVVTDANGASSAASLALRTLAPQLVAASNGAWREVCGDGDADAEPGERFEIPVRITNTGQVASRAGVGVFVARDRVDAARAGVEVEGRLAVETPAVDVGALAPGAFVDRSVTVSLVADAGCGTAHELQYHAGADDRSSTPGSAQSIATLTTPGPTCQVFTGCPPAAAKALVAPRQGLYLDPDRGGNGVSNFVTTGAGGKRRFFAAWFTGTGDRDPTWYVVDAPMLQNQAIGPILSFTRNLQSPTFAVQSRVVGFAVFNVVDAEHMTMSWTLDTRSGTDKLQYFVGGAVPVPNRNGAWFFAQQPGWGQVIHQYVEGGVHSTFAVNYVYDSDGAPRWVIAQGPTASLADATPHATFKVHCPGCPYITDWNGFTLAAGTGSIVFDSATAGRVTTMFAFPLPLNGSWVRSNVPITLLTAPQ